MFPLSPLQSASWCLATVLLAWLSRRTLGNPRCHGFYRFFAFSATAAAFINALPHWHDDIFAPHQLLSWLLFATAGGFLINGLHLLRSRGGRRDNGMRENFAFENTDTLVEQGLFRYIRHPMYSALMLFAWGLCLKQPGLFSAGCASLASFFLWLTAKVEEQENLDVFGEAYHHYCRRTRHFIPFVF